MTDVSIGVMAAEPRSAGQSVATMFLHVAGVPGTYQVTITAGYALPADGSTEWLRPGEPLQVTIPGQ